MATIRRFAPGTHTLAGPSHIRGSSVWLPLRSIAAKSDPEHYL